MPDTVKQNVQWFPGHMAKTRRNIKESLPLVDGIIELRDARVPVSSTNPELNGIIRNKPKIILLNKADLADEKTTSAWISFYAKKGVTAVAVDCKTGRGINELLSAVKTVLEDKINSNARKGMAGKALRLMVVGIPNTGKSSFINRLANGGKAKSEDRAGVTRHLQWYTCRAGLELLDTPGVLWPKFEDPEVGCRLAFTGGIKDDVLDTETLAAKLLEVLSRDYPELLTARYKISGFEQAQSYELLEMIAKKRGMLVRGGEADTERCAVMLLDELRAGKLGRISFENPLSDGERNEL